MSVMTLPSRARAAVRETSVKGWAAEEFVVEGFLKSNG